MKKIVIATDQRPNYYHGQLLLEDDFLAEQNYHINARRRHNKNLHGWGVVRGLEILPENDNTIIIAPGYAIDESGNEVFLDTSQRAILSEFGPNDFLRVAIAFEDKLNNKGQQSVDQKKRDSFVIITVAKFTERGTGLTLATIQLNAQGSIDPTGIDYSQTRYAMIVRPRSITSRELHESLRKGWWRSPFRPIGLVNTPSGESEVPPAFRVGATEALTPDPAAAGDKDRGAAGTMEIPIPPSVTQVTRLRIAGLINKGKIHLELLAAGWEIKSNRHVRKKLLAEKIESEPFMETFDIDDTKLDDACQTLALWLWGTSRTSISLVAVEFVY